MGFCEYVESKQKYFCDWNGKYYTSIGRCKQYCSIDVNGNSVPISKSDFVFLGGLAGVIFGAVFLFALYKSLISG